MKRLVWLVVPAVAGVYFFTLAPRVGLIDSGELAMGCHFLNILHPTGYPLYTVLGRLASLFPAPRSQRGIKTALNALRDVPFGLPMAQHV